MKEDSRTYRDGVGGEVGNGQRKRKNTEKIWEQRERERERESESERGSVRERER
jgi:hypothetical protein